MIQKSQLVTHCVLLKLSDAVVSAKLKAVESVVVESDTAEESTWFESAEDPELSDNTEP